MANIQNLKPFKKGQSGNPKGRPKGSLNLTTHLRRVMEEECPLSESNEAHKYLAPELIQALVSKYGNNISLCYMLISKMLYNALLEENSEQAIENIMNRLYGKPQAAPLAQDTTPELVIRARDFENITEEQAFEAYKQVIKDCNALTDRDSDM